MTSTCDSSPRTQCTAKPHEVLRAIFAVLSNPQGTESTLTLPKRRRGHHQAQPEDQPAQRNSCSFLTSWRSWTLYQRSSCLKVGGLRHTALLTEVEPAERHARQSSMSVASRSRRAVSTISR